MNVDQSLHKGTTRRSTVAAMATLLTKTVVCDEGMDKCDNSVLHNVRLTIDGETVRQVLCSKHAAPFVRMKEKMGPAGRRPRGKVYTQAEIAQKRTPRKK